MCDFPLRKLAHRVRFSSGMYSLGFLVVSAASHYAHDQSVNAKRLSDVKPIEQSDNYLVNMGKIIAKVAPPVFVGTAALGFCVVLTQVFVSALKRG